MTGAFYVASLGLIQPRKRGKRMKSNLDKFYKNNEKLEAEGIQMEIADGVWFNVKRFGGFNEASVKAALARYYKPYARQIENKTLDPVKEKEIMIRVFVEACVTGWNGIEIDGKDTAFDPELAVKFLTGLPELADSLIAYATDSKNYREDLGNS